MRNTFVKTLVECAEKDESIFLLCGDLGYSVLEQFRDKFPDRFLNVGVAEQNMAGVAAGLAKEGYNVFIYSIGNFPTLRCLEQIRYDICYHNLSVKVVAVGGGFAYGPLGTSHHTTEDIGVLRVLPNMTVTCPGDPLEVEAITQYFANSPGPGYIRLNKTGESKIHSTPVNLLSPKALVVKEGKKRALLVNGSMLQDLPNSEWEKDGWAVYSFPFVKPIDRELIAKISTDYEELVTLEEHQLSCGFGSAVAESLIDLFCEKKIEKIPSVTRLGVRDTFNSFAGTQEFLKKKMILS